ncbi:MAG: hypothetical protein IJP86_10120 [Synergistaceae bacterium]|nr:hypothetical protein [Synergistaceae bacterium]
MIDELPDKVIIPPQTMCPYSRDELADEIAHQGGKFLVSVSREKAAQEPDTSSQYRKFSPGEAREMLDVLEKIYAAVSRI